MPPLNLVGDFGGGGMFLAYGVVCALLEAQRSGAGPGGRRGDGRRRGDADDDVLGVPQSGGASTRPSRGTNLLDTGAHFYDVYRCADGEYVSIGSIEPQFYAELLAPHRARRRRRSSPARWTSTWWPHLKERLTEVFAHQDPRRVVRADGGAPTCASRPVLTMSEAAAHPHNVARATFVEVAGVRAAGAGAAASAARRRRSAARPPTPVSTPARCWPTGASPPTGSTTWSSPAPSSSQMTGRPWRRSSSSTPIPTTRRSPPAARWHAAAAEGHRVVLVVATDGEHGEVPDDLGDGETLVDRRRAETDAIGGVARRRTVSCGSATPTPA